MNFQAANKATLTETPAFRTAVYCLSLTLYCLYWTYFGLISTGGRFGWNYIMVFLAPVAAVFVFSRLLNRIAHVVRRENISSIADLLSSRYGKSRAVGAMVTLIAAIGTIPFIGQQLRMLSLAWKNVGGDTADPVLLSLLFSLVLIGFVILFSARRPAVTEHSHGLIKLLALDAIVKFVVIIALSAACILYLIPFAAEVKAGGLIEPLRLDGGFFNTFFLLTAATLCMPHLFYVGIVNAENPEGLKKSRWFLPPYFLVLALSAAVILLTGRHLFKNAADPEMYVLLITSHFAGSAAAGFVYFSSVWTAMLVVAIATVALSGMVSQQIFRTEFMQRRRKTSSSVNIGRDVMNIRRVAITAIVLLALVCSLPVTSVFRVGNLGILYTSIFVQLLPALLGAVIWPTGHRYGVLAGITAGALLWLYYIAIPFLSGVVPHPFVDIRLAHYAATNSFVQRFILTLLVNSALYIIVSKLARQHLVDRIQAVTFIDSDLSASISVKGLDPSDINVSVEDLKALMAQFLSEQDATAAFSELERESGQTFRAQDRASPFLIQAAERILAGVVGAPLARSVMFWQLVNQQKSGEIVRFLDETAQAVKLNRETLQATLNNLSQGVCVVDRDFRLVAWNARYVEIFDLDPSLIRVGGSMADIIRLNRARTGYSSEDTEKYILQRMRDVRIGAPHIFERTWKDGKKLRVVGMPMPDGRYVTSFTDVTSVHDVVADLRRANEKLEERVQARTEELVKVNDALEQSTEHAERARASQARFLAAASHDLLQPLHAARLFIGAMQETHDNAAKQELAKRIDVSIESANRLLRALLNLSRLEVGGVRPQVRSVDAGALLAELAREFEPVAKAKGLKFGIDPTENWVMSDPDLLRSVLQNLIGNAIRYTETGAVLVLCRKIDGNVRFEVKDSGPGIPEESLQSIFNEYFRVSQGESTQGAGLGLSIVQRICKVLDYPVTVHSEVGRGSTFTVSVPHAPAAAEAAPQRASVALLSGLSVLFVEHEPTIVESLQLLFERWDVQGTYAKSVSEALSLKGSWDVLLTDYHFDDGPNGLDLIEKMRSRVKVCALITADTNDEVAQRAESMGVEVIRKPVSPASLRTFLAGIRMAKRKELA